MPHGCQTQSILMQPGQSEPGQTQAGQAQPAQPPAGPDAGLLAPAGQPGRQDKIGQSGQRSQACRSVTACPSCQAAGSPSGCATGGAPAEALPPAGGHPAPAPLDAVGALDWAASPYLAEPKVREGAIRAQELAAPHGRLLFLTVFGSTLYGTALPGRSDLDLRGVYLAGDPRGAERAPGLHWSSGTDGARNAEGDCDIDLVSFERWLLAELPAGDTGALDLLFAPGHAACTLFCDPLLAPVFARPLAFLRLEDGSACASYVLKQGRKYGLEGTRLGGLLRMARFLGGCDPQARIGRFLGELAASARAPSACFIDGGGALSAGGKIFEPRLRAGEARRRLMAMLKEHVERMEQARAGRGVDWKALSHGLRAIRQQEELLEQGSLRFPLRCREEVLAVKTARHGFDAVEAMLTQGLARLETLRAGSAFTGTHDPAYARTAAAQVRDGRRGDGAA